MVLRFLKFSFVLVVTSASLVSVATASPCTVSIGVIAPLTGPLASMGTEFQKGAILEGEKLSNQAVCAVTIHFQDDQFNTKKSVSAYNLLLTETRVQGVICFASGPCNAIAPLAERAANPLIAVASDQRVNRNRQYIFRLDISPQAEAAMLSQYIKGKDFRRIGAIVAQQDGIEAGYSALSKQHQYSQHEVIKVSVLPSANDYRTLITKLLASKPDVIFLGLLAGDAGLFAHQLKQQGYRGPMIGMNFLEGEESLIEAHGALDGIVFTNIADPSPNFANEYRTRWNKEPGFGASHGYDAVGLLSGALFYSTSRKAVLDHLNKLSDFKGALGTYSALDGNEFDIPVTLRTVSDGRFRSLSD